MKIPQTTEQWFKALIAAFITSSSTAGLSFLGVTGANLVGVNVHLMDGKQFLAILLSGGIVGSLAYLQKSPVPPDENEIVKPADSLNNKP